MKKKEEVKRIKPNYKLSQSQVDKITLGQPQSFNQKRYTPLQ